VRVGNKSALELYERQGFVTVGIKHCVLFINGEYLDTVEMERIAKIAPR
jgi:ribosomal protein S18 acetylase RimI-like enzyme